MKRICPNCRVVDESVTQSVLVSLGVSSQAAGKIKAYKGRGCDKCNRGGTKGRIAVHEVMVMTDGVKEALIKGAAAYEIKQQAMAGGMRTLRQSALVKLAQGLIPASEVTKGTAPDKAG